MSRCTGVVSAVASSVAKKSIACRVFAVGPFTIGWVGPTGKVSLFAKTELVCASVMSEREHGQ